MKQLLTGWKIRAIACSIALFSVVTTNVHAQKKNTKSKSPAQTSMQAPMSGGLTKEQIEAALNEAYDKFKDLKEGKNADYIKELANVDPNIFGVALVTVDGQVYTKGDIQSQVSIQSV